MLKLAVASPSVKAVLIWNVTQAMAESLVGDDVMEEDPTVHKLERYAIVYKLSDPPAFLDRLECA